jgi:hypothetical protein
VLPSSGELFEDHDPARADGVRHEWQARYSGLRFSSNWTDAMWQLIYSTFLVTPHL